MSLRKLVMGCGSLLLAACADSGGGDPSIPAIAIAAANVPPQNVAPFECQVAFTEVTNVSDATAAYYGLGTATDTSTVCGAWTGNDYKVHVQQIATSESGTETADSIGTATYENGNVSSTTLAGETMSSSTQAGSSTFDIGQATQPEIDASYSEPFYGVVASGGGSGGGGGGGCEPPECFAYAKQARGETRGVAPVATPPALAKKQPRKDHGFKRNGIKWLLGDMDELERGSNGHRRFSSKKGDEETIVEVDPETDLISKQETKSPRGHTKARLTWEKKGSLYVRSLLEIDAEDNTPSGPHKVKVTVRILDLKLGGKS